MWELDHKTQHQRIDAFELWRWRRFLRVPWTARRSTQSILKEINPEYSLERVMLKLKLQYFGHLNGRTDFLEKTLMLGKIEGRRWRGQQRMRWLDGVTDLDMILSKFLELVMDREAWHAAVPVVSKSWSRLSDWAANSYSLSYLGSHCQEQLGFWNPACYLLALSLSYSYNTYFFFCLIKVVVLNCDSHCTFPVPPDLESAIC